MKQFTWQIMCKNFKKTLKINSLYLTRTPPCTSDKLHMFFTHVFRAFPQHSAVIRSSPQHPAALPRTNFVGALVCRGEPRIKAECCGKARKKGWCCSNLKHWWRGKYVGARKIRWCVEKMTSIALEKSDQVNFVEVQLC